MRRSDRGNRRATGAWGQHPGCPDEPWARKEQPSPSFVPDRAYFEAHVRSFTPNDLPTLYSKFPTGRQTSKYSNFLKRVGVTKLHAHPKVQATAASTAVGSQPIYHKPFSWEQFGFPGYELGQELGTGAFGILSALGAYKMTIRWTIAALDDLDVCGHFWVDFAQLSIILYAGQMRLLGHFHVKQTGHQGAL